MNELLTNPPGPPWVTPPWARQNLDGVCKWPGVLEVHPRPPVNTVTRLLIQDEVSNTEWDPQVYEEYRGGSRVGTPDQHKSAFGGGGSRHCADERYILGTQPCVQMDIIKEVRRPQWCKTPDSGGMNEVSQPRWVNQVVESVRTYVD